MARIEDTLIGSNLLEGTSENDLIFGLDGNDTLLGGDGSDILRGGNDIDFLSGEGGDDRLWGDGGNDFLSGGEGNDIFVLQSFPNADPEDTLPSFDTIFDFEKGRDFIGLAGDLTFADLEISTPLNNPLVTQISRRSTGELLAQLIGDRESPNPELDLRDFIQVDRLEFSQPIFQVAENGLPIVAVAVTRQFPSGDPVETTIELADGTASGRNTIDFFPFPIPLQFEGEETLKVLEIPIFQNFIVDDPFVEPTETINLTLSNPTGTARLGDRSTATLEIIDNDTAYQFSSPVFSVLEDGTAIEQINVIRTGFIDRPGRVTLFSGDGTATFLADYQNTPIDVEFAAEETVKTVNLPIVNDVLVEGNETVNLALANPSAGSTVGDLNRAKLTILDDDTNLQFSRPTFQVNEDGTPIAAVTVVRTGISSIPASATITLTDGTASALTDYNSTPISIDFEIGETEKVVAIPIADDTILEPSETLNLTLSNPSNGVTIGIPNFAVVEIADNDLEVPLPVPPTPPGILQFSDASFAVNEDGTPLAAVTVTRTEGSTGTVSATIVLTDGSAIASQDYISTPIEVNFADGEMTKTVQIPIVDDSLVEVAETVNLALINPTNGAGLGVLNSATLTISRSDQSSLLDFEGVGNLNEVDDFYSDRGIRFSGNALGIIGVCPIVESGSDDELGGNFSHQPSGVTALTYAEGDEIVLEAIEGFDAQLSFSYASPFREHSISIYDGLDGTGNLLASATLSPTPAGEFPNAYSEFAFVTIPFSGIARSVTFGDFANKIVIDDILLG
ncbi:MAG: Calx-beta domain-containing protein [Geitlerinemataceae cyanobacterium]